MVSAYADTFRCLPDDGRCFKRVIRRGRRDGPLQTFGAFPSGAPRPTFTPEPPAEQQDPMTALIKEMDAILEPISGAGS